MRGSGMTAAGAKASAIADLYVNAQARAYADVDAADNPGGDASAIAKACPTASIADYYANADDYAGGGAEAYANASDVANATTSAGFDTAPASATAPAEAATAAVAARQARVKALTLSAVSGFIRSAQLTEVSLDLSNACRVLLPWSLRVTVCTPNELMDYLCPGSSMAVLKPVVKTRLERLRLITKVRVETNDDVTSVFWPSSMKHLEFGPGFNRAVEGVRLPDGLLTLSFGMTFNQVRRNCIFFF